MWGGQRAEPLKGGLEAKPQRGTGDDPLVRGSNSLKQKLFGACTSTGVGKLAPFLTDHLLPKKTHRIYINPRNILWKKWGEHVHPSSLSGDAPGFASN